MEPQDSDADVESYDYEEDEVPIAQPRRSSFSQALHWNRIDTAAENVESIVDAFLDHHVQKLVEEYKKNGGVQ